MSDQPLIQVEGMQEVLDQLSFLESLSVNSEYLVPGMRKLGTSVKKIEKGNVPTFSGDTGKSLTSKVTTNGIGSVTLDIGPSKKRAFIFRFINSGAKWAQVSTAPSMGKKENPSFLPAQKLVEWVKRKLGADESNALHVAFAVAKSIGRKGITPRPIMSPTVEQVRDMVVGTINDIIHKMVEEIKSHGK